MTQPGNPDPNAHPESGQPGGYPATPPAGYGPARQGTPSQVTTAAVLGFVAALFTLLGTFILLAADSIYAILYLAVTAGLIAGGVLALTGKNGQILLITAAVATGVQILDIVITLAEGEGFSAGSLIGLQITGGIVFLLLQPQAKQFFAARR